jgi:glutamine synthetase
VSWPDGAVAGVERLEWLRRAVSDGSVEDVVVAFPDLRGRLLGQRLDALHFLGRVSTDGLGACVYLLSADADMHAGPGYAYDATRLGYGDLRLRPDLTTLRPTPWDEGAALVIADALDAEGQELDLAPRAVLRRQLRRLHQRELGALAGVELEFMLFRGSYAEAHAGGYRGLEPASRYNVDYALGGLEGFDPVVRRIRREMRAAGLRLESARGECHPGQYEIVFRYADALTACDQTVLYRTGARQIAASEGAALTFLAKYDEGEGNSGHVHFSLRGADGGLVFAGDGPHGMSELMTHFVAGQLACMRELSLLFAPNVNSYKRLAPGAFASSKVSWGVDNRLAAVRVVGAGEGLRIEHRTPGADVNPYLAVAAIIAAGLYGVDRRLPLEAPTTGHPGHAAPPLPETLKDALDLWESSPVANDAFGPEMVRHYGNAARLEWQKFSRAVTDWELARGFER